jgi:UDP:flavonoid glycosyltransferase YjiC (YdhE family)
VPVVAIGDGFSQPPSGLGGFPVLRPDVPSQTTEAEVLSTVAAVQRARGRRAPSALPGIFAADREFVCILPEFDPYREHAADRTIGPLRGLPEMLGPASADGEVFVYLSGQYDKIGMVVEGIAAAKVRGKAFLRNPKSTTVAAFEKAGMEVLGEVLPSAEFRAAVGRSRAVIHHGGVGTSQDILALGRPQIVLPMTFEQQLTSDTLFRFRVGGRLRQGVTAEAMTTAVRTVVDTDDMMTRSRAAAEAIARRGSPPSLPRVLDACAEMARA